MTWSRSRSPIGGHPVTADEPDDAALVAAAKEDLRAFTALYERYVDRVYRYCYSRLGNKEQAEDATSEVFLKAVAALHRYQDVLFAAWLFRIAHNVVVDVYRRRPSVPLEGAEDRPDPARTPESLAVAQSEREIVRAALAQLTADERAVVELPYAGWSGKQIAEALDRTPNAVKTLRYRALRRLRVLLSQDQFDEVAGEARNV